MSNTNQKEQVPAMFDPNPTPEDDILGIAEMINGLSDEMLVDVFRLKAAEDALTNALSMIAHAEVQETILNAIADYCGAMMIGTVHAMDKDHAAAIAKLTQPSAN